MCENRIVIWAIALLLVISIAFVPMANAAAYASHSAGLGRPDPLVVSSVLQHLPRIEWCKEMRSPNKPHGDGEFYFLPHMEPESSDEVPQRMGNWY